MDWTGLHKHTDGRTDRQGDFVIPSQTLFAEVALTSNRSAKQAPDSSDIEDAPVLQASLRVHPPECRSHFLGLALP